jgi:hypothetical protein
MTEGGADWAFRSAAAGVGSLLLSPDCESCGYPVQGAGLGLMVGCDSSPD